MINSSQLMNTLLMDAKWLNTFMVQFTLILSYCRKRTMAHPCQAAQKLLSSNLCELFTQKVEVIHARDKVKNIPTVSVSF